MKLLSIRVQFTFQYQHAGKEGVWTQDKDFHTSQDASDEELILRYTQAFTDHIVQFAKTTLLAIKVQRKYQLDIDED